MFETPRTVIGNVVTEPIRRRVGDQEVFKETVSMAWRSNDGTKVIGQVEIPGKDLKVWIVQAASGQVLPELPAGSVAGVV